MAGLLLTESCCALIPLAGMTVQAAETSEYSEDGSGDSSEGVDADSSGYSDSSEGSDDGAVTSTSSPVTSTDTIGLTDITPEEQAMADQRSQMEIQSNLITDWPDGPAITAESAILLDADTGTILYAKNIHECLYPASTTKMMTALLAAENLALDDTVTMTQDILDTIPADGTGMGLQAGETVTVETALYGVMVCSANEAAAALGVKIAGSTEAFAQLMNERAAELGCTETHFANANGLFDENHYTSAHDLAMIARAFFNNSVTAEIGNTPTYHFTPTDTYHQDFTHTNKHELISGKIAYSGIIGGKTGYLSLAGETLVTGAERSGMRLVCVVMKEHDPNQFTDTVTLLDYGFSNFTKAGILSSDSAYQGSSAAFMTGGEDILGDSSPALSVRDTASVTIPNEASFSDLTMTVNDDNTVSYVYGGSEGVAEVSERDGSDGDTIIVGTAALIPTDVTVSASGELEESKGSWTRFTELFISAGVSGTIYVNVWPCAVLVVMLVLLAVAISSLVAYLNSNAYEQRRRRARESKHRGMRHTDYYENHKYDVRLDDDDTYDE